MVYVEEKSENTDDLEKIKVIEIEESQEDEIGMIEAFFGGAWNNGIKALRWPIVIITLIWFQYAVDQALLLGPVTKAEEFFPPENKILYVVNV